jgi:polyhydroxyalkanoate synthesis repressor PhaR
MSTGLSDNAFVADLLPLAKALDQEAASSLSCRRSGGALGKRWRMASDEPTVIKKYANRRLYHTGTSTYVTLDDLARMVKEGEDFIVTDAKSGEDITRAVLGQIIFEQENRGQHLLPIAFLRQLIRFYGDQMQTLLPTYLESTLSAFARNQDQLREQMARALKGDALGVMEDQARRNMEMFSEAMRMWMPLAGNGANPPATRGPGASGARDGKAGQEELEALRKQLAEMQKTLETIAGRK